MGREVRKVPADWQHPKNSDGRYEPLFGGSWANDAAEWDEERAKWERGEFPEYTSEASRAMPYDRYAGRRPYSADYMPDWPESERTHLMMYETTSEGTPISPAFETPEELARWLADTHASAFGNERASYEAWLAVARGGYAPSAVMVGGRLLSGVQAMAELEPSPSAQGAQQ